MLLQGGSSSAIRNCKRKKNPKNNNNHNERERERERETLNLIPTRKLEYYKKLQTTTKPK
jgi:hypothetical protein